jgi:hypothetical protein
VKTETHTYLARIYRSAPSPVLFGEMVCAIEATVNLSPGCDSEDIARGLVNAHINDYYSADDLPAWRMTLTRTEGAS